VWIGVDIYFFDITLNTVLRCPPTNSISWDLKSLNLKMQLLEHLVSLHVHFVLIRCTHNCLNSDEYCGAICHGSWGEDSVVWGVSIKKVWMWDFLSLYECVHGTLLYSPLKYGFLLIVNAWKVLHNMHLQGYQSSSFCFVCTVDHNWNFSVYEHCLAIVLDVFNVHMEGIT